MRFDVLTLFPEIFSGYLTQSILKLAIDRGLVTIRPWNIRDWATAKHRSVEDRARRPALTSPHGARRLAGAAKG